jgi:hypothetical protein
MTSCSLDAERLTLLLRCRQRDHCVQPGLRHLPVDRPHPGIFQTLHQQFQELPPFRVDPQRRMHRLPGRYD